MRISDRASRPQRNSGVGADPPTPNHDLICRWADRHAYYIVQRIYRGADWRNSEIPATKFYRPEWEHAITSDGRSTYVVGFVDLRIGVKYAEAKRYPDGEDSWYWTSDDLLLEVKPEIESLGAVIRQINLYKQYKSYGATFGVVSPDARFCSTLEGQGIHFVECPPLTEMKTEEEDVPF